jgi:hypothetical protein
MGYYILDQNMKCIWECSGDRFERYRTGFRAH